MRVVSDPRRQLALSVALLPALGAVFLIDALTMMVVVAYGNNYLISTLGAPPSYPGYALAIYGAVKLLGALAGGWLLERVGAAAVVAFAAVLELAGLIIILATGSADGFLAGIAFVSAGIALAWLVVYLALGEKGGVADRGAATAYMGITSALASATGLGLGTLLTEAAHWRVAFSAAVVLAAGSSLMLFLLSGAAQVGLASPRERTAHPTTGPEPVSKLAMVVVFAHFAVASSILAAYGPFALRTLGLRLSETLVLLAPAGGLGFMAMVWSGHRSQHGNRLRDAGALYLALAAAAIATSGVSSPWLFATLSLPLAIGLAGTVPLVNAGLIDTSRQAERTGTVLGLLFFAEGLGSVVGPGIVALVIKFGGIREGMMAVGIGAVALALLASIASRRRWF